MHTSTSQFKTTNAMINNISKIVIILALIVGCTGEKSSVTLEADVVYTNAKIYTVNKDQPWADAIAIKDGRLIRVGSEEQMKVLIGASTKVVDLEGRFIMPGLVDTHTHPFVDGVKAFGQLSLNDPGNLQDIQQQLREYAEANPDIEWIEGGMWPKGIFPGESAMREWLDEVISDRPVTLMDQGGHAYWCNTMALEKGGFMDEDFVDPPFSIIEKDKNGVPTGTIRETALGHMRKVMPQPTPALRAEVIQYVQKEFNAAGITAHRAATGTEEGLRALQEAANQNKISLHWAVSQDVNYLESIFNLEECLEQIENRSQYASEFIAVDFAKIFVDGDLNGFGIKMMEPFEGTDDEYGRTSIEPAELNRLVKLFDEDSISVQFHAIGDQSIEYVLEALETASQANGGKLNTTHYPDHMGFITPEQIDRMIEVNGVIGFAPYFSFTFPGIHESYMQFVGQERLLRMQPVRTALDKGAIIGTGTDWASLPQDPWPLLEGFTNRKNPWDATSEANNSAESITLEEAIHIYTLGGAHALLKEDLIGSLEEGKYADFIVLDRNLMGIPVEEH